MKTLQIIKRRALTSLAAAMPTLTVGGRDVFAGGVKEQNTMAAPITTHSYNLARTGATDDETALSATAVRTRGIVKLFSMAIPDDPRLEAQPLAVGGVGMALSSQHRQHRLCL